MRERGNEGAFNAGTRPLFARRATVASGWRRRDERRFSDSMNLGGFGERLAQPLDRKAWHLTRLDQHLFAPRDLSGRRRDSLDRLGWNNHGAMPIGVDYIVGRNHHARHTYGRADVHYMNIGVRGHDRTRQHAEGRCPDVEVADRTVSDDARASQTLVDMAVDFAPERAQTGIGAVEVLEDRDAGHRRRGDMLVVG